MFPRHYSVLVDLAGVKSGYNAAIFLSILQLTHETHIALDVQTEEACWTSN